MFPMVATVDEFDQAKAIVERELTYLRQHGHSLPERVDVGTMVEVPSLLYQLDELIARVDFLSVGSNDLMQFLFAVDRGNSRVVGPLRSAFGADPARAARHRGQGRRGRRCRSRCAARWPRSRSTRWRCWRSAIARCRCRRPRIGPVKAMILDLDIEQGSRVPAAAARRAVGQRVDP